MKKNTAALIPFPQLLKERFGFYNSAEQERIKDAAAWAQPYYGPGSRASSQSLEAAVILADLRLDSDAVIAAILHKAPEQAFPAENPFQTNAPRAPGHPDAASGSAAFHGAVRERFGGDVAFLVEGAARIAGISATNKTIQEAENVRKMLFAMARDIRVIFIKLADKLTVMRGFDRRGENGDSVSLRREAAQECLDIYAPLADRLGISWMKDELEDLALKNLKGDVFSRIKEIVSLKKEERQKYLDTVRDIIIKEAAAAGIDIEVESRPKHFYSIYQKMRKRGKGPDELYDLFGIRILCAGIENCYTLLGLVHRLWKPLDGRFKDYIAMPKANGYQSLHTTVFVPGADPASSAQVPGQRFPWSPLAEKYGEGQPLEIQIRTREMHRMAEYGIASHWLYKKGSTSEIVRPGDLPLINRLKDWQLAETDISDGQSSASFLDDIKRELLKDSIYVFTPLGKVIAQPAGATPRDCAYAIHPALGNHCSGAKAAGSIVPLSCELQNTQVVEILTATNAHPHINWLRIAKTSKARNKIRSWLQQNDSSLIIEKNVVAYRSKRGRPQGSRPAVPDPGKKDAAHTAGNGARPAPQANAASPPPAAPAPVQEVIQDPGRDAGALQVRLESEEGPAGKNMMIRFARCCHPVIGDPITGYVSRGRGIIIHRKNCPNLANIPDYRERKIETEWEKSLDILVKRFKVEARLQAELFPEIEGAIRKYQGHLIEGRLEETTPNRITGFFTMRLESPGSLNKVVKSIRSVPGVLNIYPIA
ncbi:MAG: HD domain-containing protein [Treponema sp.]|jgi:GTP pyrophosphokinase|nr:HD domain-containing protein [Treponema sp.]